MGIFYFALFACPVMKRIIYGKMPDKSMEKSKRARGK
jgi:hypothetical protein